MFIIPSAFANHEGTTTTSQTINPLQRQEPDYPEISPTIGLVVVFLFALAFFLWKKFRKSSRK